jgi:hypothetical protein
MDVFFGMTSPMSDVGDANNEKESKWMPISGQGGTHLDMGTYLVLWNGNNGP